MKAIQQKLKTVQELLQKEKEADFDRFREEVLQLTQSERRDKGLCWYPLNVLKTGYTCLLYTSPSPRDLSTSRMPSSA